MFERNAEEYCEMANKRGKLELASLHILKFD